MYERELEIYYYWGWRIGPTHLELFFYYQPRRYLHVVR